MCKSTVYGTTKCRKEIPLGFLIVSKREGRNQQLHATFISLCQYSLHLRFLSFLHRALISSARRSCAHKGSIHSAHLIKMPSRKLIADSQSSNNRQLIFLLPLLLLVFKLPRLFIASKISMPSFLNSYCYLLFPSHPALSGKYEMVCRYSCLQLKWMDMSKVCQKN